MDLQQIKSLSKRFSQMLLDLFFPRDCLITGKPLPHSSTYRYLHESAIQKIHWVQGHHCQKCGYPFDGEMLSNRTCPSCLDLNPIFNHGKTLFLLKDTGKELIHEFKYNSGYHLLHDISLLINSSPEYKNYANNSILIPVPLHPKKLRKRGFNQSLLIAQAIAKSSQNTHVLNILNRIKPTKTQTKLSRDERQKNVKNAFAISNKIVLNRELRYIIVDDVFTTGATLNECALVLKNQGITTIDILTLGHG